VAFVGTTGNRPGAGQVLTARKLTGAGGLWAYLDHGGGEHDNHRAEYYLGGTTPHEVWGAGAARLGLDGLDRARFDRLAAGCHPDTGERLVQTQHGQHIPGIDLVFSPPKSVSVAMVDATPTERAALEAAHLAATRAGLGLLQERAAVTRPTRDGHQVRAPGGLVAGLFTHHTARPTTETVAEGRPPDPHLHTHGFVFSLAWSDGRWRSVDSYGLFRTRKLAEAAYQVDLAAQLRTRGWHIETRTLRGGARVMELAGHDPAVNELFSSRHREIEDLERRWEARYHRPPTKLERWRLSHDNRLAKDERHGQEPEWAAYRRVMDACGLGRHRLHARLDGEQAPLQEREAAVRAALLAPDGLTRDDAIFHRNDVPIRVLEASVGFLSLEEARDFAERFAAGPDLVVVDQARGYLTTQANLDREAAVADAVRAKREEQPLTPTPAQVERAAARAAHPLTGEQRAAVEHLLDPDRGMGLLLGWAGTGKTTTMRVVVDATRQVGGRVIVVATSGDTAQRTAHGIGVDHGLTIEAFASRVERGRLWPDPGLVLLVDEAVMVDTARMGRLLAAAGPARVIAIGDPEQYQAIGAGGWWTDADRALGHAELTQVFRQCDPADRQALADVRHGHAAQALANLNERGRVHVVPRQADAIREVVHAWEVHRAEVGTAGVLMLTDTSNDVIDTLNRGAQARRAAAGELGPDALAVHDPDARRREELRSGDRVAFVATVRTSDGEQVRNGARGTITAIDLRRRTATVDLDGGPTVVTVEVPAQGRQPLRLAYAVHAMRAQGAEADVALVLPGAAHAHRQAAYPMLSRGRGEVHVFVDREHHGQDGRDPVEVLAERWSASATKQPASARLAAREQLAEQAAARDTGRGRESCASTVWDAPEATWAGQGEREPEWSHTR
jgi:conjugative relaxase-like TrwC/TraI family protein